MDRFLESVVDRPVAVGMTAIALVVFGIVSFAKLDVALLPDISYPSLTIQTEMPDAAPSEVEQLVTDDIEPVVGVVSGLRRMHSVSRAGASEITLEFGWKTDMTIASLDVMEKLDLVDLPERARSPLVFRFDPSLDPLMRVALESKDVPMRDLRRLAETVVKERVEVLEGVAAAKVVGGADEEVRVEVDEQHLSDLGLTIADVVEAVSSENVNRSGGQLRARENTYIVRVIREFEDLDDLASTVIAKSPEGGEVRISDVGRVVLATRSEDEVRVRVDGRPAVEIHMYKEGDSNSVEVARRIRERLETLREDRRLSGIDLRLLFDQARFIESSVSNVQDTAIIGALLAALILFLFLRDLVSTFLIAMSIPLSVAVTFLGMNIAGVGINVMSLGGLALGIGMLVDNSVVVLEAVRRRRERGDPPRAAAIEGSREVAGGVVSSTLTTIAVFAPLVFVEGVAGQLFRDQALVVTISLVASLAVAITVIPTALARSFASDGHWVGRISRVIEYPLRPIYAGFDAALRFATGRYRSALRKAVRVPLVAPAVAFVAFLAVVPSALDLGTELVPQLFQGEFHFDVELADGTPIERTDRVVAEIEREIAEVRETSGFPITAVHSVVGGTPVLGDTRAGDRQQHIARVHVSVEPGTPRQEEQRVIDAIEAAIRRVPGVDPRLGRPTLFSFRKPVEVEVYSEDLDDLDLAATRIAERIRELPGIVDIDNGVPDRTPEIHVELDPVALAQLDISRQQAAQTLAQLGIGEVATEYTRAEEPLDIRVVATDPAGGRLEDVRAYTITFAGEDRAPVPLSAVAEFRTTYGAVEVRHVDGERAAVITGGLSGLDLGGAIRSVETELRELGRLRIDEGGIPTSTTAKVSGQHEEAGESLESLYLALCLAIFLVYLVLASTFESLRLPFVIVLTVPLGLVGAVLSMLIAGEPIGVIALIGVILLAGIVVNNGIIYIARILQHRASGLEADEAVLEAGVERLRPILITSATTILGLLPLAIGIGEGAELRQPLATTVIGGLFVGTFLTLFVIPCGYRLVGGRAGAAVRIGEAD